MSKPTPKQMSEFWQQVDRGRITSKVLQMFIENPNAVFPKGILERLIAEAEFDWVNENITPENFPVESEPKPDEELVVVHLNKVLTTDEVIAKLDKKGLVPAGIEYLVLYGKKNPDEQRKYPIVGLGSVWRYPSGDRYCPCLYGGSEERALDLRWVARRWLEYDRFLARRKQ